LSGFLDRLKSGVSEAGNKAKVLVEVNRLKMQNSGKQKDIDKRVHDIGNIVFLSSTGRKPAFSHEELEPIIADILRLEGEMNDNNKQIRALSNEKECSCGQSAPLEARFCPTCGQTFNEEAPQ